MEWGKNRESRILPKLLCSVDTRCISQARAKILEELMRRCVVVLFCGLLIRISDVGVASWLSIPSTDEAKTLLNSTHHHPDWVQAPAGSKTVLTFVTYPDRADKAAVIIITAPDQKLSDRLRAIADQMADEGFIGVVPDALSNATADVD